MKRTSGFATILAALGATLALAACSGGETTPEPVAEVAAPVTVEITDASFTCIRDLTPVRGYFVGNLLGDMEATLAVANSETGGVYPVGSVVQLVPTEAMVKREAGYNAATKDWEFFELVVSPEGTKINVRGATEVVNRFGGNCLACHAQAAPEWDLVCEQTHGCDPIPVTPAMARGIQKTDPRCGAPVELTAEEGEAMKALAAFAAAAAAAAAPPAE